MDNKLKNILFDLMESHSKLAQAEYERNPAYNDSHPSAKVELQVINFLEKEYPGFMEEFFKRVTYGRGYENLTNL